MQKKLFKGLLATLIFVIHTSAFAQNKNAELLFFQHTSNGLVKADKTPGCYQIELSGLDKKIIYLSTAPEEITGTLNIPTFITSWQHQQATHAAKPNAILHATLITANKTEVPVSDVFVLNNIAYHADKNTMVYRVCRFKSESKFKLGLLRNVDIFVDPFHRWPP